MSVEIVVTEDGCLMAVAEDCGTKLSRDTSAALANLVLMRQALDDPEPPADGYPLAEGEVMDRFYVTNGPADGVDRQGAIWLAQRLIEWLGATRSTSELAETAQRESTTQLDELDAKVTDCRADLDTLSAWIARIERSLGQVEHRLSGTVRGGELSSGRLDNHYARILKLEAWRAAITGAGQD